VLSSVDIKSLLSALSVNVQWSSAQSIDFLWRDAYANQKQVSPSSLAKFKEVNWRSTVLSASQTKKNLEKKLVVIDTLSTSHHEHRLWFPDFERIALMSRSTWGRWAAITRFKVSSTGEKKEMFSGELWDLDRRTLVQTFNNTHVMVAAGYLLIIRTGKAQGKDVFSIKYESIENVRKLAGQSFRASNSVVLTRLQAEPWDLKIVSNSDNLSPNTCLYYEKRDQLGIYVIRVIDLEQKKSLYGVSRSSYIPTGLYGNSLAIYHKVTDYSYLYPQLPDVNVNHKICGKILYVENSTVWISRSRELIKYDLVTMQESVILQKLKPVATSLAIFQDMVVVGLLNHALMFLNRKTHSVIRTIQFGKQNALEPVLSLHTLFSGKLAFMNSEHMSVLSCLDKDVNNKVQMLRLKHDGRQDIVDFPMGKFHSTISQSKCFYYSMTFFHESKWKRYSIVNNCVQNQKPYNKLATWVLRHRPTDSSDVVTTRLDKYELFRQFFIDVKPDKIMLPERIDKNMAYGTAWIFFEELVGSRPTEWKKSVPTDNWQFVKDRLSATAVKHFVDRVLKDHDISGSSSEDSCSGIESESEDLESFVE
jgi:hypothetical protein